MFLKLKHLDQQVKIGKGTRGKKKLLKRAKDVAINPINIATGIEIMAWYTGRKIHFVLQMGKSS